MHKEILLYFFYLSLYTFKGFDTDFVGPNLSVQNSSETIN